MSSTRKRQKTSCSVKTGSSKLLRTSSPEHSPPVASHHAPALPPTDRTPPEETRRSPEGARGGSGHRASLGKRAGRIGEDERAHCSLDHEAQEEVQEEDQSSRPSCPGSLPREQSVAPQPGAVGVGVEMEDSSSQGYLIVEEDTTDSSLVVTMEEVGRVVRRKGVVKRKRRVLEKDDEESGANESEVEVDDVEIDRQLDQALESKSRQHNLTTTNVRNIIHEVITNEHVVAMMKAAINETEEPAPVFEPTMTRSKFKEVVEKGVVIPTWNISPIKKASEIKAPQFVDIPLEEEDSSDEEYRPDEDEEDETGEETFQESDMESTASSPRGRGGGFFRHVDEDSCSPWQGSRHRSRHLRVESISMGPPPPPVAPPTRLVPDSSFLEKLNAVEEELAVCMEPYQPLPEAGEGAIMGRTRSKRPLRNVPLGRLEAELRAPDFTPDMYESSSAPEDKDWTNWLRGLMSSDAENDEEGDDEDDPEYNFLADSDEPDREDYRNDKAVRITKKEVNELMEELFETLKDDLVGQDEEGHDEEEESQEETSILETHTLSTSQAATRLAETVLGLEEEPIAVVHSEWEDPEGVKRRQAVHVDQGLLNEPQPLTLLLYPLQRARLQQQVQQHVQLLTQVHMLTSPVSTLQYEAQTTRQLLFELDMFAAPGEVSHLFQPGWSSAFRASNLQVALHLVEELRVAPVPYSPAYPHPTSLGRHRKYPLMPAELAWLFATRPAFLYPELLPRVSLDPTYYPPRNAITFTSAEQCLVVLGLRNMQGTEHPTRMLSNYLIRRKTAEQIQRHVADRSRADCPDNVIKTYKLHNVMEPMPVACGRVSPGDLRPPVEREEKNMPAWLKKSLPLLSVAIAAFNSGTPPTHQSAKQLSKLQYSFPPGTRYPARLPQHLLLRPCGFIDRLHSAPHPQASPPPLPAPSLHSPPPPLSRPPPHLPSLPSLTPSSSLQPVVSLSLSAATTSLGGVTAPPNKASLKPANKIEPKLKCKHSKSPKDKMAEPIATEPTATEPIATEPRAAEPIATEPRPNKPKQKRGRPSKSNVLEPEPVEPTSTELTAEEPKQNRKPGRRPKLQPEVEPQRGELPLRYVISETPERTRGRPPKHKTPNPTPETLTLGRPPKHTAPNPTPAKNKRKPGRPPKRQGLAFTAAKSKLKLKPGRPPKHQGLAFTAAKRKLKLKPGRRSKRKALLPTKPRVKSQRSNQPSPNSKIKSLQILIRRLPPLADAVDYSAPTARSLAREQITRRFRTFAGLRYRPRPPPSHSHANLLQTGRSLIMQEVSSNRSSNPGSDCKQESWLELKSNSEEEEEYITVVIGEDIREEVMEEEEEEADGGMLRLALSESPASLTGSGCHGDSLCSPSLFVDAGSGDEEEDIRCTSSPNHSNEKEIGRQEEVMSPASDESTLSIPELQETMEKMSCLASEVRSEGTEEEDERCGSSPSSCCGASPTVIPCGEEEEDEDDCDVSHWENGDVAIAQDYLHRVCEAVLDVPGRAEDFLSSVYGFERRGERGCPVELYHSLTSVLQPWPQLLRDYAAFLRPSQALRCGLLAEQQLFESSRRFLRQLELGLGADSSHYQEVICLLQGGPALSPADITKMKAKVASLLKSHTHLQEEFWVFFKELYPQSLPSSTENRVSGGNQDPKDYTTQKSIHASNNKGCSHKTRKTNNLAEEKDEEAGNRGKDGEKEEFKEKKKGAEESPPSAPAVGAKNISLSPSGKKVVLWTREADRSILTACQQRGANQKTFQAVSAQLGNKTAKEVCDRFKDLVNLFRSASQKTLDEDEPISRQEAAPD